MNRSYSKYFSFPSTQSWFPCEIYGKMSNKPTLILEERLHAFYHPLDDRICIPIDYKADIAVFYSALFHQLIHSTGHFSRLNREDLFQMYELTGNQRSSEEIIARIGTIFLIAHSGLTINSKTNIDELLGSICDIEKDDFFACFERAKTAVDFILNC